MPETCTLLSSCSIVTKDTPGGEARGVFVSLCLRLPAAHMTGFWLASSGSGELSIVTEPQGERRHAQRAESEGETTARARVEHSDPGAR